ncbi:MAG: lipopolysaccharide biosynthesis protein [Candidatus Helarchaeota archaeon]
MPLARKVAKGGLMFGVAGSVERILALFQSLILIRLFTKDSYGLYIQVFSLYTFIGSFFLNSSIQNITIKEISRNMDNKDKVNQILYSYFIYEIIISIGIFSIASILFLFDGFHIIPKELLFPLFILEFNTFEILSSIDIVFIGINEYKYSNLVKLIAAIMFFTISILLTIYFIKYTQIPGYFGPIIGIVIKGIIRIFIAFYVVYKHYGRFFHSKIILNSLLVEGVPYGLNILLVSVLQNFPVLILGKCIDSVAVANYNIIQKTALNTSSLIGMLIGQMLFSLIPPLIKNKNIEKVSLLSGKITKLMAYFIGLILLIIINFANEFTLIMYGSNYLNMANMIWYSSFIVIYNVIAIPFDPIFLSQNKIKYIALFNLIRVILFLSTSFILTSNFGLNGMILSIVITYSVSIFVLIVFSNTFGHVNYFRYLSRLFIIMILSLGFSVILNQLFLFNFLERIILFISIFLIFHVVLILSKAINKEDLRILNSIVEGTKFERYFLIFDKIMRRVLRE